MELNPVSRGLLSRQSSPAGKRAGSVNRDCSYILLMVYMYGGLNGEGACLLGTRYQPPGQICQPPTSLGRWGEQYPEVGQAGTWCLAERAQTGYMVTNFSFDYCTQDIIKPDITLLETVPATAEPKVGWVPSNSPKSHIKPTRVPGKRAT